MIVVVVLDVSFHCDIEARAAWAALSASTAARSERAGIRAAIDQPVLSGDVPRVHAAQERARTAKFVAMTEAAGGDRLHALLARFVDGNVLRLGLRLERHRDAVGVEHA